MKFLRIHLRCDRCGHETSITNGWGRPEPVLQWVQGVPAMRGDLSKCWNKIYPGDKQCQNPPTVENANLNWHGERPVWCDDHHVDRLNCHMHRQLRKYKVTDLEKQVLGKSLRWMVPGDREKAVPEGAEPPRTCDQGHGDYDPNCAACTHDLAAYRRYKETRK